MKRLSELPAEDRLTTRAHALIRAMGPTLESEERLRRVRRSLDAQVRPTSPRWGWRVGLAVCVLGVSAAAAVGSSVLGSERAAEAPAAHATPPSRAKLPARPASFAAPAAVTAKPVVEAPRTHTSPPAPAKPSPPTSAPAAQAAVPPLSDVARVHEAAKALRRDGDAERALQLLERSGAPVTGPLAEEALALRIEASVARGDGRQARLATAYLANYPKGRYRELAKRALSGSKP